MAEGRPPLSELELRSDLSTVNCDGPKIFRPWSALPPLAHGALAVRRLSRATGY